MTQAPSPPVPRAEFAEAKAVLFDFDFTLADSSVGVTACVQYALERMGLPVSPPEEIIKTIGLYLPETLVALHGESVRARGMEFLALFTEKADEVMEDATHLYPETPAVLRELRGLGFPIGVVSTKYAYRISSILARDGLRDCVSVIIGGEDVENHKPHPEGLLMASARLGVAVADCVYVGDSEVDALAAASAEMPFVAVETGSAERETLAALPHRAILPSVAHIMRRRSAKMNH